jgi:hypothetical protein
MTREEKKLIRLQITELLDQCEGCKYRCKSNASIHICPGSPIGQQMQKLGKKLWPKKEKKQQKIVKKSVAKKYRPWVPEEEEYLLQNLHMKRSELAKQLGRTYRAVLRRISDLKKEGRIHAS